LSKDINPEVGKNYVELLKEFIDFVSWKYEGLKTYDTSIIQHRIPLKIGKNPFRHKLRHVNPLLLHVMEKDVRKILDSKIIIHLRYCEWVENLVPMRKKNGEISLCVDFKNMNKCSLKDNYTFPKMDHILQKVVGYSRIFVMYVLSGYNQVAMHLYERDKTSFTTRWGTFMYGKMPLRLINVGYTFQ
jgi:hypothetical protein